MMKLMEEEFELSRQHELKPFQMLLQSQQPSTHAQQTPFETPHHLLLTLSMDGTINKFLLVMQLA